MGLPDGLGNREEAKIAHTLNHINIEEDMRDYCDGRFIQYIKSGGPCNLKLPFSKVTVKNNYGMTDNGLKKRSGSLRRN